MKKATAALLAAIMTGALLAACNNPAPACEDDALTSSVITGKGGGSKSRSGGSRYSKPRTGGHGSSHGKHNSHSRHGHYDFDDDCD